MSTCCRYRIIALTPQCIWFVPCMLALFIRLLQVNELVAEDDICRFILQSERNGERAISREIFKRQAATAQRRECIRDVFSNHESADRVGADVSQQSSAQFVDAFMQEEAKSSSLSSLLEMMRRGLRHYGRDFARLQHTTNG